MYVTRAVPVSKQPPEPLYFFVFTHYPTHQSGGGNQSRGLISPLRRFTLLVRKCSSRACQP
ncbi:hypothetical protein F9L69_14405 [Brucella melitensis]|nr:hypothetical protein CT124_13365 [Brucella melitensis]AUS59366.1 hypothetical protein C1A46_13585 [Brucella abortus]AUS48965.1 hypothetical protein C0R52_14275 [Brucella melitensis]AUS56248.1 hypothetical protein CX678_14365 [Brucella melitensis]AVM32904.1 hypothetical protein CUC12_14350 [Brucella melitensis]